MAQPGQYPASFSEYAIQHPEILPDYHEFANDTVHFTEDNPDTIPVLIAPNGIGKSRLLVPALLEEGEKIGLQSLGSINLDMHIGMLTFDWHQHEESSEGIYRKLSREGGLFSLVVQSEEGGREGLRKILHQRFTEGRDIHRPGLFIIDDLIQTADEAPWFVDFIGKMAKDYNVRLIATQPLHEYIIQGAAWVKETGRYDHDWQNHTVSEYYEGVNKFGRLVGQKAKIITIPEQHVSVNSINTLLNTYGLAQSNEEAFKNNALLRRLRVVEGLVNTLFAQRSRALLDDGTVFETVKEFREAFAGTEFDPKDNEVRMDQYGIETRIEQGLTSEQKSQIEAVFQNPPTQ